MALICFNKKDKERKRTSLRQLRCLDLRTVDKNCDRNTSLVKIITIHQKNYHSKIKPPGSNHLFRKPIPTFPPYLPSSQFRRKPQTFIQPPSRTHVITRSMHAIIFTSTRTRCIWCPRTYSPTQRIYHPCNKCIMCTDFIYSIVRIALTTFGTLRSTLIVIIVCFTRMSSET